MPPLTVGSCSQEDDFFKGINNSVLLKLFKFYMPWKRDQHRMTTEVLEDEKQNPGPAGRGKPSVAMCKLHRPACWVGQLEGRGDGTEAESFLH